MSKVHKGRFTATIEGEFVVFLIGMRFNKLWKVHKWMPVFTAMPRMLRTLQTHPEKGLLSTRFSWAGRTITLIQYWRSFDQLERFARNSEDPHLEPWRRFNQRIGASGDVGVYHETYRVQPGGFECIYSNTPVMGLAAAGRHISIDAAREEARQRMAAPYIQ